ncbi:MAG: GTPase HflX, partial [Acidimicrobiales bacterium]
LQALSDQLRATSVTYTLMVPYGRGDVIASLHREGLVLTEMEVEGGMQYAVRLDDGSASRLAEFVVAS